MRSCSLPPMGERKKVPPLGVSSRRVIASRRLRVSRPDYFRLINWNPLTGSLHPRANPGRRTCKLVIIWTKLMMYYTDMSTSADSFSRPVLFPRPPLPHPDPSSFPHRSGVSYFRSSLEIVHCAPENFRDDTMIHASNEIRNEWNEAIIFENPRELRNHKSDALEFHSFQELLFKLRFIITSRVYSVKSCFVWFRCLADKRA